MACGQFGFSTSSCLSIQIRLSMIECLGCVISESIGLAQWTSGPEISRPSILDFGDDAAYENALRKYGNAVASKQQIHSRSNSSCFKNKARKRECRFGFPRIKILSIAVNNALLSSLEFTNLLVEWESSSISFISLRFLKSWQRPLGLQAITRIRTSGIKLLLYIPR